LNKYKKGFTPDEAALLAIGLSGDNLSNATSYLNPFMSDETNSEAYHYDFHGYDSRTNQETHEKRPTNLTPKNINKAQQIKDALIDEIFICYEITHEDLSYEHIDTAISIGSVDPRHRSNTQAETEIEIYRSFYYDESMLNPDPVNTKITRKSLAKWFYNIDELEIAKKFDPNIDNAPTSRPEHKEQNKELERSPYWQELKTKTETAILKFPEWSKRQQKIKKSENLHEWIKTDFKANERETEIIKKVMTELFETLN